MNRTIRGGVVFLIAVCAAFGQSQNYTITTIAGGTNPYFSTGTGDGGPATSAALGNPTYDVTFDGAGNLYVLAGPLIRKITPDGNISTYAGGGTALGESVQATKAQFAPLAIVADAPGNLYIADTAFGNSRIRKVDTKGIVTTVAGGAPCCDLGDGGPAISAYLSIPYGLALDAAGNLYVAQVNSTDNLIRKIGVDGSISTIAGGGQSTGDAGSATSVSLSRPTGVAVDSAGNIYIAESAANRIREVSPGGAILTIAGTGAAVNSGDGGLAFLAGVNSPWHIAVDPAGDIFVTQINDARVRLITLDGRITTVAGNGTPGSSGDGGSAASAMVDNPAGIAAGNCGQAFLAQASATIGRVRLLSPASPIRSAACPVTYTISGQTISAAKPLAHVQMSLSGSSSAMTQTDGNGAYSFPNLVIGGNYTITPTLAGYTFVPPSLTFSNLSADQTAASFTTTQLYLTSAPATFSFSVQQGASAPPVQAVTISVSDGSTTPITLSALSPGNWLSVSVRSGSTPLSLNIAVNPGALPPSSTPYSGTISVSATGSQANLPALSIPVSLLVTSGAPTQLTVAPTALNFSGSPTAAVQTAPLQISSSNSGSPFSVAASGGSWLSVSPSSGSTPGAVTVSANPAGLTSGTYSGTISVSAQGAANSPVTVPVMLTVTAPGLQATPSGLSFSYQINSLAPPFQSLTISSSSGTQAPFSVTANGGSWLIPGSSSGTTPATINVFVNPIGLSASATPYAGTLTISSPGSPSISVPVSLSINAPVPPQLIIDTTPLSLSGLQGASPTTKQIQISNAGGILNFTAATTGGDWLSVSPPSGSLDSSTPQALTVTADPSSLRPGTYLGSVIVTGAGTTATVPVTFSVTNPSPVILVSQAGLSFTAVSQGGSPLPQQIGILNVGNGELDWTASASTLSGGNWLQISATSGTVQQPYLDVSLINVSIDPVVLGTLAPGDYYGQLQVAGPAVNSPQLVTVILTVLAPGLDPGPEVVPSSLIFTGLAGASPDAKNVAIGIRKAIGDQYISGHIGGGFTYSPASSAVQPNQPANLQVAPDFSTLSPGEIDRGTIALQFSDGTARTIALLTVVAPSSANVRLGPEAANNCANLNLQWRMPAPPNFSVVQGRAQTLELQVVDNCGNLVGPGNPRGATVHVTFSNKDADLNLVHVGDGIWTGTWKPVNPSITPVTVVGTAFNSNSQVLQSGQSSPLFGTVLPGNTPLVTAGGVQHAASYVLGAPIAPGTLITLKGLNLADADSAAPGVPLPTLLNGTQVFLGTEALPLLYSGAGQVNVQVPFDIPVDTRFQVTVQRDSVQSLPEQLVVAAAQPGIFTLDSSGAGQGVIYRSDGVTYAQPGTPATAGETISIFCTGLGTVTPAIPAGTPPPASPISTTDNAVSVTIGGQDGQATAGTLVPGQPGVYQVAAIVPAGVSGSALPVVVTVAGQSSPAVVTMAVQ